VGLSVIKKGRLMKIEVGKWYLTREGRRAFVERYDDNENFYCMKGFIEGYEDDEYAWTVSGAYFRDREDSYDLVEELETETEIELKKDVEKLIDAFEEVAGAVKPIIILEESAPIAVCPLCGEKTSGAFYSVLRVAHQESCPVKTLLTIRAEK